MLLSLWQSAHRLKSCVVRAARDLKRTIWFAMFQGCRYSALLEMAWSAL